jgi:hypothetical protein
MRFILDRHAGQLEYRESMLQSMQRDIDVRRGRRPAPKQEFKPYNHLLVPDRERFEHFETNLLDIYSWCWYNAVAALEIIPAWLRFLESVGLIDSVMRTQTMHDLAGLAGDVCKVIDDFQSDPAPRLACERWPQ